MKKILLFILILFFFISCLPLRVIGQSAVLIDDLKAQIQGKEDEIKKLEEQAAAYRKELQSTQSQKNTLNNQISTINNQIKKIQNDIALTTVRIDSSSLKIEELALDIEENQNEIDKKKDSISSMMQILYEYDQTSLMEMILTKNTFSELLDQIHYLESIQEEVHREILTIQGLKQNLESKKTDAEARRNELYTLQHQLGSQKQVVNQQKDEKNYLLNQTKGQEKQYQSLLNETLRKQQEIEQQIFELEDKLKRTYDPSRLPESHPGVLSWPLEGILTQGYGYTAYSKKLYKGGFHNGIDLSTSYGEPIAAAREGTITAIGNCGRYAYGKWIAVKHDNGLTTLYGHLSAYGKFKTGDSVSRGDVIGYEGNTGYSTGAHLHFGVYATETFEVQSTWYGLLPLGAHLDPMKYL